MHDRNYVKYVLTYSHTHYEWKNKVIKLNGGLHGRHYSWVEMKCLDNPNYYYCMKGEFWGEYSSGVATKCLVETSQVPMFFPRQIGGLWLSWVEMW